MLRTRITDLLGIEHPVLSGGMGSSTSADLVVAVSEAGGLGILGATHLSSQAIREQVAAIRSRTRRPFGVNLLIAFTDTAQLEACLEARVPVLSTAWGDPVTHARRAREAGVPLVHMVPTAAQAGNAARAGVTAVIAQGQEGGGHVGTVSSLPLLPAAVAAVAAATAPGAAPPPVIAAGGIADGRGLVAALALGAEGVLLGTRFLATLEAPVPTAAKAAICAASEADTVYTPIPDLVRRPGWLAIGAQSRAIRNQAIASWLGRETELAALDAGGLQRIAAQWEEAQARDDVEGMVILAGQDCGLIHEVLPAGEVVRRVVAEAEAVLRRLSRPDLRSED
ncbi:MAG: nitronate monooxygenase [Chloroflexota bacterium]|nr:nitronate monooxygenase [Chloroflexota bacterium]